MRLTTTMLFVCCASGFALADPGEGEVGLQLGAVHELSASRGLGALTADTSEKRTAFVAKLHADWRVGRYFSVGFAVPLLLNGVGPTSDEYHAGLALRGRADYPVTAMVRPYIAIEQGLAFARLPTKVGWSGQTQHVGVGVQIGLTNSLSVSGEVLFERTDFAGDSPESDLPGPLMHGEAMAEFLGAGIGVEARL